MEDTLTASLWIVEAGMGQQSRYRLFDFWKGHIYAVLYVYTVSPTNAVMFLNAFLHDLHM